MNRRAFLVAAGTVSIAGCTGGSGSQIHTVGRTVTRKTTSKGTKKGGRTSTSEKRSSTKKPTASQTATPTMAPSSTRTNTTPGTGTANGTATTNGTVNGTATTTTGGSKQSISRSAFARQLSTRAQHNGFTGSSQVGFDGDLAYVVYSESTINRGANRGPWREAYTSLVKERDVKWDLEGRVTHSTTGGHWYTYQIKRKWASAYLSGRFNQRQYKSKIENSEQPWK